MTALNEIEFFVLSWKYYHKNLFSTLQKDRNLNKIDLGRFSYRVLSETGIRVTR